MLASKKGKCFPVVDSEKGTFGQTDIGCSYICGRTFAPLLTQPKQLYPIRKYSPKSRRTLGQCPGSTVEVMLAGIEKKENQASLKREITGFAFWVSCRF